MFSSKKIRNASFFNNFPFIGKCSTDLEMDLFVRSLSCFLSLSLSLSLYPALSFSCSLTLSLSLSFSLFLFIYVVDCWYLMFYCLLIFIYMYVSCICNCSKHVFVNEMKIQCGRCLMRAWSAYSWPAPGFRFLWTLYALQRGSANQLGCVAT